MTFDDLEAVTKIWVETVLEYYKNTPNRDELTQVFARGYFSGWSERELAQLADRMKYSNDNFPPWPKKEQMTKYTIEEAYHHEDWNPVEKKYVNGKYLVRIRVDRQEFQVVLLTFDHWPSAEEIDIEFKKEELKLKEFLVDKQGE